jgi:lipopolysaccharide export system ATP-binding protein
MKIFGFKKNPLKNREENGTASDEVIEAAEGQESHGVYIDESEMAEALSAANCTNPEDEEASEGIEEAHEGEIVAEEENVEAEEEDKVLRTENLVKIYGKRTVVNHVSIDVTQGEIVGLLGPNGAGKTTTFYMTTGLITPNAGKIFLNDTDITKYPVYKRAKMGIGYLAQEASVFRKLSVEDNIRAVLEMTNTSKAYQKEKLESLIAEFRLEKVRKNYGDRLSGGERRRTEIARCLAIDPKFIMLDEPFAGVDPIAVEDIQSIVYKLKEKNIGILITDHNANETLSITDRAYLLFEGKILFQGTSEELAANPVVREKYLGRNFEFRRKHFN